MQRNKIVTKNREQTVVAAFERELVHIAFDQIAPLHLISERTKATVKFKLICASIQEVGLVEPIVVARDRQNSKKYILLDGHLRLEVLKEQGLTETSCIVSTDDEAFTYVECHSQLTPWRSELSLRTDPCATLPLTGFVGGYWSDRHGIFKRYSTLGIEGQDAHPRDFTADWTVSQHHPEIPSGGHY